MWSGSHYSSFVSHMSASIASRELSHTVVIGKTLVGYPDVLTASRLPSPNLPALDFSCCILWGDAERCVYVCVCVCLKKFGYLFHMWLQTETVSLVTPWLLFWSSGCYFCDQNGPHEIFLQIWLHGIHSPSNYHIPCPHVTNTPLVSQIKGRWKWIGESNGFVKKT